MKTCISSSGRKIKVKYFAISRSAEKNKNLGCHKKSISCVAKSAVPGY